MRIEVQDLRCGSNQTRAYAEYRVFSTLKPFGDVVHASVVLVPHDPDHRSGEGMVCRVTITMLNEQHLEAVAHGRHAYAAIDGAASRIESLLARQRSVVT